MNKLIAITPGEPAGIGPDIVLSAINTLNDKDHTLPVVIADKNLLITRAKQLKLNIQILEFTEKNIPDKRSALLCLHTPLDAPCKTGTPNKDNADYILRCLSQAVEGCKNGLFSALVTGPVNKAIINDSGIPFSGHTEFLADLDQRTPVMMLATKQLKVALATTHLPLTKISSAITETSLSAVIQTLHDDLNNKFGIQAPKILVLGLNPHAGENGHLGDEEIITITPTLEKLRQQGIQLTGPVPADTAFNKANLSSHDAVLAMYHDQGLPVLKYSGFGEAVNITLGLSFIRTSVDHGTALELAGTGRAKYNSLIAAYDMAKDMALATC